MTDRVEVYQTEVPSIVDVLNSNKFPYVGAGRLSDAILGSTTQINGFACTPASPTPDLTADVDTGEIYKQEPVDTTVYVTLPVDPTLIVKQGIFPTKTNFPFPAPTTPGDSIDYLVQIGFLESDTNITARPYYNTASTPTAPLPPIYVSNTSTRNDAAVVSVLAGTPAPTGTQVAPSPDPGSVGAWVVTVSFGQTQIISANINPYASAPFITEKLKDKISEATGDARYKKLTSYFAEITGPASQAIGASQSKVIFNSVQSDNFSIYNNGSTRIEPTTPGRYTITQILLLATSVVPGEWAIHLHKNGVDYLVITTVLLGTATGEYFANPSIKINAEAGDYFEIFCDQSSGSPADIDFAFLQVDFEGTV